MLRIIPGAVVVAAALTLVGSASAEAGGVTAKREPISVDFTLSGVCTFPIRVQIAGWMVTTPTGAISKSVYTLSNESLTRSLTQQTHSIIRGDDGIVVAYISLEKIVLPGSGVVFGSMGRLVFYFDDEGNVVGSEFHGRQDPYSQWTTVVCGYLS